MNEKTITVKNYTDAVQCKVNNKRVAAFIYKEHICIEFLHLNEKENFNFPLYKKSRNIKNKTLHNNTIVLTRETAEMLIIALHETIKKQTP